MQLWGSGCRGEAGAYNCIRPFRMFTDSYLETATAFQRSHGALVGLCQHVGAEGAVICVMPCCIVGGICTRPPAVLCLMSFCMASPPF